MDEDKPPETDYDDAEILYKFNKLLNKYQNQGGLTQRINSVSDTLVRAAGAVVETGADKIPTLTDVVILHPSLIHPQPKRLRSIQQILDAALLDAQIEMSVEDRKALANALELRMVRYDGLSSTNS
ncbi:MAG: hypothetical protein E6Q62_04990 [Nitrosomonas sp.]|nr:MAG: hypothetical protein E6Q62_04990 [Nitrosomonas sp.]